MGHKPPNMTEGGDGMYGFKHSEASKLKNRNAHLGKKASPETRALLSELGKKAIFSAERKENIRLSKLGNKRPPLSLSWKSKISLALRGRKGRKASEAWKQWKSGHSKKFWADPVYRAKQTQSHKEWWTPERRKIWALQMRNTKHHLGKKHSEQQRKNISDGVQRALTISPKPGKSVRCIDTGEVFPSLLHAVEKFGGYGSNLSRSIGKGYKFFGRQFEYAG